MASGDRSAFPWNVVVVASSVTAMANLPAFLLGAMAHDIRDELAFSAAGTGLAVSSFFAASALSAPLISRLVQRAGPALAVRAGACGTGLAMVLIATAASTWTVLVVLMAIAGASNTVGQTAANLTIAELSAPGHDGLVFGLKQGAVPVATMLAGFAVPAFSPTFGWRWAFALGAVLAGVVTVLAPRLTARAAVTAGNPKRTERPPSGSVDWTIVSLVAGGAFLGAGIALGLAVYTVEFAIHQGWSADQAGMILAVSSLITVAARVLAGWWMDRRSTKGLLPIGLLPAALMIAAGAVGCLLLAVSGSSRALLVVGVMLGLGLGWGWPGLMHLTIVQLNRTAAALATGLILFGVFGGGVVLPSMLGLIVEHASYSVAWVVSSGGLVVASAALLGAHAMMRSRRAPD